MREADWLGAKDPDPMLDYLRGRASDRKLRLFAAACCRVVWDLLDVRGRSAVEVAESYAEEEATSNQLALVRGPAQAAENGSTGARRHAARAAYWATKTNIGECLSTLCAAAAEAAGETKVQETGSPSSDWAALEAALRSAAAHQADLLRECFGNPFQPVAVSAGWLAWGGGIVRRLAQAAYEERAFDRLPVLADALEEAGCSDAAILAHCRAGGPHVRGCWVVDALTAKK
jgi:hypothetical protein